MKENPPTVCARISGTLACFSRPEFSVERLSYPWITPSAARGLLEGIFWSRRMRYEVRRIEVLRPIKYIAIRRNEVGTKVPVRGLDAFSHRRTDLDRQQRNTMALVDVDYLIAAEIHLNAHVPPKGQDDNHGKYVGMFERRLHKGQCFHRPYLGCREFAADVRPPDGTERPIPVTLAHGLMLYDFSYPKKGAWKDNNVPRPLYFDATLDEGVVSVPSREQVFSSLGGNVP